MFVLRETANIVVVLTYESLWSSLSFSNMLLWMVVSLLSVNEAGDRPFLCFKSPSSATIS